MAEVVLVRSIEKDDRCQSRFLYVDWCICSIAEG